MDKRMADEWLIKQGSRDRNRNTTIGRHNPQSRLRSLRWNPRPLPWFWRAMNPVSRVESGWSLYLDAIGKVNQTLPLVNGIVSRERSPETISTSSFLCWVARSCSSFYDIGPCNLWHTWFSLCGASSFRCPLYGHSLPGTVLPFTTLHKSNILDCGSFRGKWKSFLYK